MACYRYGGCGPYEMRPCSECPASKPEYTERELRKVFEAFPSGGKVSLEEVVDLEALTKSEKGRKIMRDKLTELLGVITCPNSICNFCEHFKNKSACEQHKKEVVADHLIANGVTVQEWFPASEPPKKITNKVIVLCKNGYRGFGHYENYMGKQIWYNLESDKPFTDWDLEDCESYDVTHWMPLPEPPKEMRGDNNANTNT